MKTIKPNPTEGDTGGGPELINDNRRIVPEGKGIGALVGGQSGTPFEIKDHSHAEAYWRQTHSTQDFAEGRDYEDFHDAYRTGYEGYTQFGEAGQTFEETETKLRERYETENGSPKLPWTIARAASHAAWHWSAQRGAQG